MQIASSYADAKSIKSESSYKAQQLEFNSRFANLQAKQVEQQGREESKAHLQKVKSLVGRQRAGLAAQGIEVNTGTALDLQTEAAGLGALDALTIRNNAFREATGYRIEGIQSYGQAQMTRSSGKYLAKQTLLTGGMKAITSAKKDILTYSSMGGG